eukprot:CAMPEP_0169065306 /NCGR_PEP_ID=MMETSP1015-20121227/2327_1 /TAXON_ID=342587 /ORGANISM="Karlodinium micrum, Strain CCMP2283" /LENGTH=220 /DNA_ID=CAMNT_0009123859 /DNA_START=55 /DNA_END=717 /DNA_ORIENTATION=-
MRARRTPAEAKKMVNSTVRQADRAKLEAWFRRCKSRESEPTAPDRIEGEGIQAFCDDLDISPLDPVILVIAYHCQASQMGVFTFDEFAAGMSRLGCDDAEKLKAKLDELRALLADPISCKEVYSFTYMFSRDPGCKSVPVEVCIELWKLLLSGHFALLDEWLRFVEAKEKGTISMDLWMMVYDLATKVKADLSDYDEDSSWPVLLDEFVEDLKANRSGGA